MLKWNVNVYIITGFMCYYLNESPHASRKPIKNPRIYNLNQYPLTLYFINHMIIKPTERIMETNKNARICNLYPFPILTLIKKQNNTLQYPGTLAYKGRDAALAPVEGSKSRVNIFSIFLDFLEYIFEKLNFWK